MTRDRAWLTALLVVLGTGWGITQPLSKIAVSEGYRHFGLIFWQMVIGAIVLGVLCRMRGQPLVISRAALRVYAVLAVLGTLLPNAASYEVARHLPSGWLSLVIATVPLVAFPIALAWGLDQFSWARLAGLLAGLAGVACLALPIQAWLIGQPAPDALAPALLPWLLAGLIAPALYALEGNVVARWGLAGLDPIQALHGASLLGAVAALPLAALSGSWINPLPPYGAPDAALVASSVIHAAVYTTYVWLVGRAGAVFAAQVSYLVTATGVIWAMVLLGERYGAGFYIALALMFTGLFLVQPRTTSQPSA